MLVRFHSHVILLIYYIVLIIFLSLGILKDKGDPDGRVLAKISNPQDEGKYIFNLSDHILN